MNKPFSGSKKLYTYSFLRLVSFVFVLNTLFSCTAPENIGALNLVQWRSDRGGCDGKRISQIADFKSIEKELLAKHIDILTQSLGRPDIQQLATRDRKLYVYFFEKGPHCDDITKKSDAKKVILHFNAVGLLSEITYQSKPLE